MTGAARSGPKALEMAGVTVDDIDVVELYDCYTYTVAVSLEDYGFCEKGEGGPFVADGKLGPGGALPNGTTLPESYARSKSAIAEIVSASARRPRR